MSARVCVSRGESLYRLQSVRAATARIAAETERGKDRKREREREGEKEEDVA